MTITGTPEAQWKSQYYIYDKIRQEGWIIFSLSLFEILLHTGYAGDDEVRLRAEIYVPTALIGRLVGKGGHNVRVNNEEREKELKYFSILIQVRQLQQSTGAIIKLPEDSQQTSANEVPVKIIGTFQASQVRSSIDFSISRLKCK